MGESLVDVTREALSGAGGPVAVQLRAKGWSAREQVALGRRLRAVTADAGALLVVNGRVDVARAIGADGVHLPERALPVPDVRALLGSDALIGRSCHDAAGVEAACCAGADYLTLGPVGAVAGKNAPLGVRRFGEIARSSRVPVLALGGVTATSAPALLDAGAHGMAVIRAVYGAEDPKNAVTAFFHYLDSQGGAGE